MCFCSRCLPQDTLGYPACGERIEHVCQVRWISGGPSSVRNLHGVAGGSILHSARSALEGSRTAGRGPGPIDAPLSEVTEDVDHEIQRLERQLAQLRSLSSGAPSGAP